METARFTPRRAVPRRTAWTLLLGQIVLWTCMTAALTRGEEPAAPSDEDADRRATAVALNYCRASLHRIRQSPTLDVLDEEQEKILNNLNLGSIKDADVLKLYSSILDEMTQVQVTARERGVLRDRYNRQVRQGLSSTGFVLAAQIASAQFGSAAQTGASSWWDYRNTAITREIELWKLEKQQVMTFVQKSTQFLDTTWKLAHERNIPDEWLIRGNDLDNLQKAMQEEDLEVRLRILERMEPFMTCYPPYWYYKARTQQALAQWEDSIDTYGQLQNLADGHFRRDEMLAAAMANRGVILEALGRPEAVEAARTALRYSTDVWEANVLCARILERHQQFNEAEDAILRNLDVDLETEQSTVYLVSLYYQTAQHEKLAKQLADAEVASRVPGPVLLQCAAALGTERTPPELHRRLASSLRIAPRHRFGKDDIIVSASRDWHLEHCLMTLKLDDQTYRQTDVQVRGDAVYVRFAEVFDAGSPLADTETLKQAVVDVQFPGCDPLRLAFDAEQTHTNGYRGANPTLFAAPEPSRLRLASVQLIEPLSTAVAKDEPAKGESKTAANAESPAEDLPTVRIVDIKPQPANAQPVSLPKVEELAPPDEGTR